MKILIALKHSQPMLNSLRGTNIDETVARTLVQISFHFFKIAAEFERQARGSRFRRDWHPNLVV